MLKAIIIDDEPIARQTVRTLVKENCPNVRIVEEAEGVLSGIKAINKQRPDLIFLDVQMKDGDGFDLLDQFPNPDFRIIFTTAYDQFATRAFEYNAVHYLSKPIDPDDLVKAVRKVSRKKELSFEARKLANLLESMRTERLDRIALTTSEGLVFLKLKDIIRLESSGNYSTFYTLNKEKIMVSRTLKEFDDLLPEGMFFRVHQSHIVSLKQVKKVLLKEGVYALTSDEAKVPVSRRKKDLFIEKLRQSAL